MIGVEVDTTQAKALLDAISGKVETAGPILDLLGDLLRVYEAELFASQGFGTWAPLAAITVAQKGHGRVLVDTGGLLRALTSPNAVRVVGEAVVISTIERSAGYLKKGARGMPKRDPAPEPPARVQRTWADKVTDYLLGDLR